MTEEPDEKKKSLLDFFEALSNLVENVPDEVIEQYDERVEMHPDEGMYEKAKLRTPEGASFLVGPVHLWGKMSLFNGKQNVDLPIEKIPEHLHESGLGECELTVFSDLGVPLLSGDLRDDGNFQEGLGTVCVAVQVENTEGSI